MHYIGYLGYIVGVLGIAFAVTSYRELWKWARQCERARIVVAYNNRVRLNHSLKEWLTWANTLGNDERAKGRVVFTANKCRVAILRPDPDNTPKVKTRKVRRLPRLRRGEREKVAA